MRGQVASMSVFPASARGAPFYWLGLCLVGIIPFVAVFAPMGMTVVLVIAGLASIPILLGRPLSPVLSRYGLLCAILLAVGLASSLWAVNPLRSLHKTGQLACIAMAGLALLAALPRLNERMKVGLGVTLAAALAGVSLLLIVERWAGFPLQTVLHGEDLAAVPIYSVYNRGLVFLAAAVFPAAFILGRDVSPGAALALVVVVAAAILGLKSTSAAVGLVVGVMAAAIALWRLRAAVLLVVTVMIIGALATGPIAKAVLSNPELARAVHHVQNSAGHRLYIWDFTFNRILERPLLGWGMDSSRELPNGHRQVPSDIGNHGEALPLHPHNVFLQIWAELGIVGLLPFLYLAIAVVRGIPAALNGRQAAMGIAAASAILVPAMTAFGIWQSWWISTFWLLAAITVALLGRPEDA